MCGILGTVSVLPLAAAEVRSEAMRKIAHRGPDGAGEWVGPKAWFGHRRLSIVDVSDAGSQPMVCPISNRVMVFNGEIYNYLELREELKGLGHRFEGGSDSEVLLRGFHVWGPAVFQRANGMWAVAIWDPNTETLTLSRDRFGVKPLYYTISDGTLCFGSEPAAVLSLAGKAPVPSAAMILPFLITNRFHHGTSSFYEGLHAFPKGHTGEYTPGQAHLRSEPYWTYPAANLAPFNKGEAQEAFDAIFSDAVRLRMRSDVPVGLTLSGGLDSTAVLASIVKLGVNPAAAYTSVFGNGRSDERSWARTAGERSGVPVIEVPTGPEHWGAMIDEVLVHMAGPTASPAIMSMWSIMQHSRADGIPVLLEGQGADELFGGYPQYMAIQFLEDVKAGRLADAYAALQTNLRTAGPGQTFGWIAKSLAPGLTGKLLGQDLEKRARVDLHEDAYRSAMPADDASGAHYASGVLTALHHDHSRDVLPSLLHYGDSISMAHGIEIRLPFMDYRLVELVFSGQLTPVDSRQTKSLIRSFLERHGQPEIAARQDKLGYPTAVRDYLASYAQEELRDTLASPNDPLWTWVHRDQFARLVDGLQSGSPLATFHLWKAYTLARWLRLINAA